MSLLSTYLHFSQLYLLGIVFIFTLVLNIQTFDYELKPLSLFSSTSSEPTCYISPEVSSWRLWICDEKIMLLVLIWNANKTQRLKPFYHQETSNQNQYQNPREKKVNIYICTFTRHREAFRIRMNIMLNYHHRETIRMFNGFFLIEITEVIYFCLSQATENKPTQLTELPPRGERADPHLYSPEKVSSFVGKMTWLPSLLFWF